MMKSKSTIIGLSVFIIIFCIFLTINNLFDKDYKYSCIDENTNTTYRFNSKDEMEKVCSKLNKSEEDLIIDNYPIYNDLINEDNSYFSFDPYVNTDGKLSIIISITYCNDNNLVKSKINEWFRSHSYNMSDYTIEYEYPCNYQ